MNVYLLEWCDCIYESSFTTVSAHSKRTLAYKAMKSYINEHILIQESNPWVKHSEVFNGYAWRVRKVELDYYPGNERIDFIGRNFI